MAIASKINDNEIIVLDGFGLESIKTKAVAGALKALGLDGVTTLIVLDGQDNTVFLSARNIEGVSISPVRELNALSVLKPRRMLVTKAALDRIKDGSFASAAVVSAE
jgi:large subunit ribosomal protein L4